MSFNNPFATNTSGYIGSTDTDVHDGSTAGSASIVKSIIVSNPTGAAISGATIFETDSSNNLEHTIMPSTDIAAYTAYEILLEAYLLMGTNKLRINAPAGLEIKVSGGMD